MKENNMKEKQRKEKLTDWEEERELKLLRWLLLLLLLLLLLDDSDGLSDDVVHCCPLNFAPASVHAKVSVKCVFCFWLDVI